jgi:hypothetical protein
MVQQCSLGCGVAQRAQQSSLGFGVAHYRVRRSLDSGEIGLLYGRCGLDSPPGTPIENPLLSANSEYT